MPFNVSMGESSAPARAAAEEIVIQLGDDSTIAVSNRVVDRPSAPAIRNFGKIRAMRVTYASQGGFRQWAS
jgi:hypothetical protein